MVNIICIKKERTFASRGVTLMNSENSNLLDFDDQDTNDLNFDNEILEPNYYSLESDKEGDQYLKVEYLPNSELYKYNIVNSFGKEREPVESDLILSHVNSIENLNEDLSAKLMNAFIRKPGIREYNIISVAEDLIEIPIEQTNILQYRNTSQLIELGRRTLESMEGDFSNRAIKIFDKLHPGNGTNIFIGWLASLSTVMGSPIIVIVKGDPGTGKTEITVIIIESIPRDHVIKRNNATESSLFGRANFEGENYLDKKILYLGDLGDRQAMSHTAAYRKYIRILVSDGEVSRELSDVNKPKEGSREVLDEKLTGKPSMIYSTVRDGEIEQQETDRAIELTPNLSKKSMILKIILLCEDPTAELTKELKSFRNEWMPKLQGVFEYLRSSPQKVLLPWDLTKEEYGLRDVKIVASITRKIALVNQNTRERIGDYIMAAHSDIVLALTYVQDGGLERSRLQQVYDEYGTIKSFTRDDLAAIFPDSYDGPQGGKSAHRAILKPALENFDSDNIPLVYEDKTSIPYLYYFRREPSNEINFKVPKEDYNLLEEQYPNLPWEEYHNRVNGGKI